jgi:hypothetical protein
MPSDDTLKFHLDGEVYDIEDFELGELEWLETEMGESLDLINFSSMKAAVRVVCMIKRRENPEFSLDEARKLKLSVFDEQEADPPRPTKARKGTNGGPQTSRKSSESKSGR